MQIKKLLLALAAASFIVLPGRASAQAVTCVNCVLESTGQRIAASVDMIARRVSDSQQAVVNAITGAATATNTAISETGKLTAEANVRNSVEMKKAEIDTSYEPLDPCGVTAAAKGGSALSSSRPAGSGRGGSAASGGPASPTAGATRDMQETLKIANGVRPNPSPEVAAALATSGACGTFAKGTLREAACKGAGFAPGVFSGFPNADLKAETLIDGPQTAAEIASGAVNRKLTVPGGNTSERMAVNAFIRNLETPVDLKTLSEAEYGSEAGRNYIALRDSYDAVMSLSTKPLRDQESLITANKVTIPVLKQMLKSEDGAYIAGELKAYPSWQAEGISLAHLTSLEAKRRYMNEGWFARIAGASDKQIAIEKLQLQAFTQWTNVAALERLQQIAVIQGATAGSLARTEKMPQLIAAHRAARR